MPTRILKQGEDDSSGDWGWQAGREEAGGLSKKEIGSWTWTTVWCLLGGQGIRGLKCNGKNRIKSITNTPQKHKNII